MENFNFEAVNPLDCRYYPRLKEHGTSIILSKLTPSELRQTYQVYNLMVPTTEIKETFTSTHSNIIFVEKVYDGEEG